MSNTEIKALLENTVDAATGIVWATSSAIIEFIEVTISKLEEEKYDISSGQLRDRSDQIHMWVFRAKFNDRAHKTYQCEIDALSARDNALRVAASHYSE